MDPLEQVIWLSEIPVQKECRSITHNPNLSSPKALNRTKHSPIKLHEKSTDIDIIENQKWIEIKKPKTEPHPKPPLPLEEWVEPKSLEKYHESLKCYSFIFQERLGENGELFEERLQIKDKPGIQKLFFEYYEKIWKPWAEERKRLDQTVRLYNDLFEIHESLKTKGGFLNWFSVWACFPIKEKTS